MGNGFSANRGLRGVSRFLNSKSFNAGAALKAALHRAAPCAVIIT